MVVARSGDQHAFPRSCRIALHCHQRPEPLRYPTAFTEGHPQHSRQVPWHWHIMTSPCPSNPSPASPAPQPVLVLRIPSTSLFPGPSLLTAITRCIQQHDHRASIRIVRLSTRSRRTTIRVFGEWNCPYHRVYAALILVFCQDVNANV